MWEKSGEDGMQPGGRETTMWGLWLSLLYSQLEPQVGQEVLGEKNNCLKYIGKSKEKEMKKRIIIKNKRPKSGMCFTELGCARSSWVGT